VRFSGGEEDPGCHWPTLATLAVSLLASGCAYVDPQCLAPGLGVDATGLLRLDLNLQHSYTLWPWSDPQTYTEHRELTIDSAGWWEYTEGHGGELTICRRVGEERLGALEGLWTSSAGERARPLCAAGYGYRPWGYPDACRAAGVERRRRASAYLPYLDMTYYAEDGPVALFWDLESQLPGELEESVTGMLGLLCGESTKLRRILKGSLPELAARAGCANGEP